MIDSSPTDKTAMSNEQILSIVQELSGIGQVVKLDSNRSLDLNKPDTVYLVTAGYIDVFAVKSVGGDSQGPRMNIIRADSGSLILGLLSDDKSSDIGFIGVSGAKTELLEFRLKDLMALVQGSENKTLLVSLVDDWIKGLQACLCPKLGQKPVSFQEIKSGAAQKIDPETVLGARHGLFWVSNPDAAWSFLGQSDLGDVSRKRTLPITKYSWVVVDEQSEISSKTTLELVGDIDQAMDCMADFHELVFSLVRLQYEKRISEQTRIIVQEQDQEKRLVESALENLSSTINKDHRDFRDFRGKPLLDACQMVGAHIGIKFVQRASDQKGMGDPLKDLCEASRVRVREVILTGEWWKKDHGSFLGFMSDDDRPVAILGMKPGVYVLGDPGNLSRKRIDRELASSIKPLAYTFQVPFPPKALNAWDLVKFSMKGLAPDIWRNIGFGIIVGLLGLITPIATGILIDDIIPSEDRSQLLGLSAAFVVTAICITLFQFVQALAVLRIEGKASFLVQSAVWDRLLALPVTFFRQYPAGDLANRTLGIDQMRQLVSSQAMSTILAAVFSIFQVGLLFYYSIQLAIVGIVLAVITLIVPVICLFLQLKYQRPLYNLLGKIQAFNLQVINGIAKLRISAGENRMFHRWAGMFSTQKDLSYKSGVAGNILAVSMSSVTLAGAFTMFTWTFFSTDKTLHAMSPGHFMAFISAFTSVLGSAFSTLTTIFPMMQVKPIYERTKPILSTLPEVKPTAAYPGELSGHIELSRVSFRYNPDGPPIIKDFSLEINPREFVALVGPSGSGKSTLLRLLLGFEQPESGSILYDGQDLTKMDVKAVRRQIGVVLQNGVLFSGSIFENIVGSSPFTLNEAWQAARMAQLEDDINSMPMGMNTVIGEGGEGLSGGQRQRLLIARAVVRQPRILFFDEATSALDNERQELVSQSIEKLEAARLVLAHRLSTIKNAHKICVIVDGALVELGNYDELMAKGGVFADLAKRQIV